MSSRLVATAVIKGVDQFSGPMAKMAMNAVSNARKMSNVSAFAKTASKHINHASMASAKLSRGMTGSGTIFAAMASTSLVRGMAKWDEAARKAQATALVWKDIDYKPVRKEMMDLAREYPIHVGNLAGGVNEFHQAGMTVKDTLASAFLKDFSTGKMRKFSVMEMLVQGGLASGESLKTVGGGVTDVIMSMGLAWDTAANKAKSFKKINDLMAHGTSVYNQGYVPFLNSLKYAAPVAKAVGMDVVKLFALTGALANAGMKDSMAGTGMRAMLIKPLNLSGKKQAMLHEKWGIDIQRFITKSDNPRLRSGESFAGFMGGATGLDFKVLSKDFDRILKDPRLKRNAGLMGDQLMDVLRKNMDLSGKNKLIAPLVNEAVRDFVSAGHGQLRLVPLLKRMGAEGMTPGDIADIFGLRHVPKALALIDQMMSEQFRGNYDRLIKDYKDAAAKKAAIQMRGTLGDMKTMASAFDVVPKIMMQKSGVWKGMGAKFRLVTSGLNALADASPGLQKLALYSVMAVGAMAPLGFAFMGIGSSLSVLAGGLGLVASIGTPALLALGAGAKLIYDNWEMLSGMTSEKFFGGLVTGAMVADDLIRSLLGSVKSLFGFGGAAGSSGAASLGAGMAASMMQQHDLSGFLMRRSMAEGGKGPWTWVAERWLVARNKLSGIFTDIGALAKTHLGAVWDWIKTSSSGIVAWLNSDISAFSSWMDGATSGVKDFFSGLFGGFKDQWKGSELSWVFKQVSGAINNMFGPSAVGDAQKQGRGLAQALYNPLTTMGRALSGQYGTAGFLIAGTALRKLVGPFAHVGANLAIMATAVGRLGLFAGAGVGRLLMVATGLTAVGLAPWLVGAAAGAGALYVAWDKLSPVANAFADGFMKKFEGSKIEQLFDRGAAAINRMKSAFSGLSDKMGASQIDWEKMAGASGDGAFDLIEFYAGGVNDLIDAVGILKDYIAAIRWPEPPVWMQNIGAWIKSMAATVSGQAKTLADNPRGTMANWALALAEKMDSLGVGGALVPTKEDFRRLNILTNNHDGTWSKHTEQRLKRGTDGAFHMPPTRGRFAGQHSFAPAGGAVQPWGAKEGIGLAGQLDITGKVEAELKGKGRVDVGVHIEPSPDLLARINRATASDNGGHIQPNVGVSGADAVAGN